jgi:hypothetical protein
MSVAVWSILASITGTVVALCIAYLHRKQMRQIELNRRDSSAPLVPPPHKVTRFLRRTWFYLAMVVMNLAFLIREMHKDGPVTRNDIFDISTSVAGILFATVLLLMTMVTGWFVDKLKELL